MNENIDQVVSGYIILTKVPVQGQGQARHGTV